MAENYPTDESKNAKKQMVHPRFCEDCGLSLVKLDTWCSSRACEQCGKEVFFVRPGEDGGIRIEAGERFHIPQITLSLDPASGGRFSRYGLEGFVKQLFSAETIGQKDELVDIFKKLEKRIDAELVSLDCISHCDLESDAGVDEAAKVLESHGLSAHKFSLIRSSLLRECCEAIQAGDALQAAYSAHLANVFKEFSLLEHHHLKEIIWLGYGCYVDLTNNEGMTEQSAKERKLIKGTVQKIRTFDTEYLFALAKDGGAFASRLSISGISEGTLSALVDHELDRRKTEREEILKKEEIRIKKSANSIKTWGLLFTLANGLILIFYKNWLG